MKNSALFIFVFLIFICIFDLKAGVTVYEHGDYRGRSQVLKEGRHDVQTLNSGVGNDRISSIKVDKGYRATLFEHGNFGGRKKVFTSDTSYVGNDFNDKTSGIIVEKLPDETTPVTLYSEENFGGTGQNFEIGKHDQEEISQIIGKNNTLSVKLANGYGVTLYGNNFSEPKKTITKSTTFVGNDIKGKISCIDVFKSNLAEDKVTIGVVNFGGRTIQELSVGDYTTDKLSIGDNNLSAIYVPKGFVVILYDNNNFSGDSIAFSATENSIRINDLNGVFDKKVSSITVDKVVE